MEYFLCLETATAVCSVALGDKNGLICERTIDRKNSHTETITIQIKECMQECGIDYSSLSAIGISKGPGSYTGLRVGTSVAKGLAYAHDIPLIGVDTLHGLAYNIRSEVPPDALIMPMIDARRMEVYTAIYDSSLNCIKGVHNLILDNGILSTIKNVNKVILCGNGASKADGLDLGISTHIYPTQCSATSLLELCKNRYFAKEWEDLAYFSPNYFKSPKITKSTKKYI